MKKYLTFCILVATFLSAQAQSSSSADHHRRHHHHWYPQGKWGFEAGLNTAPALRALTRKTPDSSNINPYAISLRLVKGRWGVHAAAGGKHDYSYNSVAGFADSKKITSNEVSFRTGLDYSTKLGRRFTAHVGADYVLDYFKNQDLTDSGFDVVEVIQQQSLHGAGLTTGISYWLTPRLAIMTEANFQWLTGYRDTARRFKNFPELNDNLSSAQVSTLRKSVLSGVFVVYHF